MPTEKRGSIGSVKPSGWHTVKYDDVDGKYLYNRCHLIGYQLTGENANTKNLITGTRYLNINGMLPFEDMVADYIKETGNHIMYRVTPVFDGDNLVASGVQIEAYSVEDDGDGICFNVYCYNNQPNITIDYATGDSRHNNDTVAENKEETKEEVTEENNRVDEPAQSQVESVYILNTNTKKIHLPTCSSVKKIKEENKEEYTGNINDLLSNGYSACKKCNP